MTQPSLVPDPRADTASLVEALVRRRFLGTHHDPALATGAAEAEVARVEGDLSHLRVQVDGADVGHVWLLTEGDALSILDAVLDDVSMAEWLGTALEDVARRAGLGRLTLGIEPGEPVAEALAVDGGFEVASTQMRLGLDQAPPPEPLVSLQPMGEERHAAWSATTVDDYAAERTLAGEPPEVAARIARDQHALLLPDGLHTADHHFFTGTVDGEVVGTLWLGTERPLAFVYDVAVDESQRRRGYGAGLMRAAAVWAHEHGHHAIGLNVFGHNHGAHALYVGLGYDHVETFVTKALG